MRTLKTVIVCALALATTLAGVGVTPAAVGTDSAKLRRAVTTAAIMEHLKAFQDIADANRDTRAAGTSGYDASVAYVVGRLEAAGYEVSTQTFSYDRFVENSPPAFERLTPDPPETYTEGFEEDFLTMEYSGSGDVRAPLVAANGIVIPSPGGSTSGCAAGDFPSVSGDWVALIQRGTCPFRQKAENAAAAGAVGVVIFNEGNEDPSDDRVGVVNGTLDPPQFSIPVIGTSFAVGRELYNRLQNSQQVEVRLTVDAGVVTTETANVIADSPSGRADRTVVVGAHLDSVPEGPGINDNGTGSAVILEVAEQMAELGIRPRNRVRFAFWGAEESGLIGSEYYVANLGARERKDIAVNLNFDMLGSPNYVRFVYDGNGSDTADSGPVGSGVVEEVFLDYFASENLATEPTAFDGRSDYGPFIAAGIPAGGLFSGAEDNKTEREAGIYGGVAGLAHDPCYHAACDTLRDADQDGDVRRALERAYGDRTLVGNVNKQALEELADGAAHATLVFAETTSAASGTDKGEGKPKQPRYKGPLALR